MNINRFEIAIKLAQFIVAFTTLLFGSAIFNKVFNPPLEFKYQFGGAIDQDIPIYEITEELSNANASLGHFNVIISSNYSGDEYAGPVGIKVTPSNGAAPIYLAEWKDFRTSSRTSKKIEFTPTQLYSYSGLSDRQPLTSSMIMDSKPIAKTFDIEILYNNTERLDHRTITVVYTPWYHVTQLSD